MAIDDDIRALVAGDAAEALAEARVLARKRAVERLADTLTDAIIDVALSDRAAELPGHNTALPARDTPTAAFGTEAPDAGTSLYLYGVVPAESPGPLPDGLRVLREGSVAAVAAAVDAAEFAEDALRRNLGDMAWVERTARFHEAVLDAIRRSTTVVPMRMCTVYADEDGVREMLRRERDALDTALENLVGKTEWGVKVFAQPSRERDAAASEPPSTGTAYLEQRRRDRDRSEEHAQEIERAATEIHEQLAETASEALILAAGRTSEDEGDLVLNGVYLVADESQDVFTDAVRRAGADHVSLGLGLRVTGPWPAYNFVRGTLGTAW